VSDPSDARGARRVFYQEMKAGDVLKLQAQSNESPTGGGARDLRVSPEGQFRPIFERMFPQTRQRRSNRRLVTVNFGDVRWAADEETRTREIEVWPPTDVRPYELRIAKINEGFPADVPESGGRVFVLLVQNDKDEVWGHYITEEDLRSGEFNQRVSEAILACLELKREGRSARGYVDLSTGQQYCHE
jgi:hypothetical protein